ncbi:uncharacterized protein Z520_06661 [Fonsecaea multimorphosa CBS 102226]|uniref:Uncharacterized protein n=1 Tax=Fonsecaea multimorphosa CBS 102226 TaxID=1442371 RepID=A0A0D2KMJ0_9EURO|nr:uncharacterized protein Z520_06661 [Fonsecaea multimorphosa CBS 102226]KIX97883.1 hypothetical protein Z520_06661 [Fonsecaea multimorphosa CBS 102226]OAL23650.1 hypothetical protein AYO22_06227 [Fonsecaea multimorphosa]
MLSQLWSRINRDNIPCHYRSLTDPADSDWRCETYLYHCCAHYTNPHCCHYWYPRTYSRWRDECEFITPEAYFAIPQDQGSRPRPRPPLEPEPDLWTTTPTPSAAAAAAAAVSARSVRRAWWRAIKRVGGRVVRRARVYCFGRESVERREFEDRVRKRKRVIRRREGRVMGAVERGYLGMGLWRCREEEEEEEGEDQNDEDGDVEEEEEDEGQDGDEESRNCDHDDNNHNHNYTYSYSYGFGFSAGGGPGFVNETGGPRSRWEVKPRDAGGQGSSSTQMDRSGGKRKRAGEE